MVDLAEHNTGEFIPLRDIAGRQEISDKYLENILPALTKAGFVDGLRGKGGGYRLARPADAYTVGSILKLVEGDISPVSCLAPDAAPCVRAAECRTLGFWQELKGTIDEFLESRTLADLCESGPVGNDFVI
jgi:Rrf2 family protein